jgi:hypothetical protein
MSETANTIIKGALRALGAIATGETPTASEMQDGLEALQMMLRNWSAKNLKIPYITFQAAVFDGSDYYTIGPGGDIDTVRPVAILGGEAVSYPLKMIDFNDYQTKALGPDPGMLQYLWYNPVFPLGELYVWGLTSEPVLLNCLNALTDPTAITDSMAFPPEYDEAIKWNLAVRLAPEYGKEASQTVIGLAAVALFALETRNFANQINAVKPEIIKLANSRYNIDRD